MKISKILHVEVGLSALPIVLASDLKPLISKIAMLTLHDRSIGFFYVSHTNHIFTLYDSPYGTKLFKPATTDDLLSNPDFYLNDAYYARQNYPKLSSSERSALKIKIIDINEINLKELPSIVQIYNDQQPSEKLKSKFLSPSEVERGIIDAIDTLIKYDVNLKKIVKASAPAPIVTSPSELPATKEDNIDQKLIDVISHYMFEYHRQRFFFVSDDNDWLENVREVISQSKSNTQIILDAYDYFHNTSSKQLKSPNKAVATLLLNIFPDFFNQEVYMREDNGFQRVDLDGDQDQIVIFPIAATKNENNQKISSIKQDI